MEADLVATQQIDLKVDTDLEHAHISADGLPVDETIVSDSLGQLKRYRLIQQLGSGAMDIVYLAHDLMLSRYIIIKVPRIDDANYNYEVVRFRFRREAQAIAQLDHPGICRLHDFGEVGGLPYLTMTYIKGKPLSHFLATKQFQVRQAVVLVGRIAKALRHAHLQGVLHRDLKPANILINQEGKPIVT
ncbi:MAG: serine/threonine protein kinase, partial [Planctomycetaceae bacterium]|nr:serine/threonine protein kinase [Planctomycetaceae bacterium]